jgi:hypothetical protein
MLTLSSLAACGSSSREATTGSRSATPEAAPYKPPASGAIPYRLVFEDRMGSSFRFDRIVILLDGAPVLTPEQHDAIRDHVRKGESAAIGIGVAPGDHKLQVLVVFTGDGQGSSSYLKGYKFEIRSSRSFTAAPDGEVKIIAYEQDASALEERPALRYAEMYPPGSKAPAPSCSCPCK